MTSLNGIFAAPKPPSKNFLTENKKKVRQMSGKSSCSTETRQPRCPPVRARSSSKPRHDEHPPDGTEFPRLRKQLFVQCRNQSCQTDQGEASPGDIIRLPSSHTTSPKDTEKPLSTVIEKLDLDAERASEATNTTPREVVDTIGRVEEVLKEKPKQSRRSRVRIAKKEVSKVSDDPECPAGHTAMPDKDRLDMLETLTSAHEARIQELNKLPVGNDTLRIRTRKIELEKLLNQLEEGIKLFNKPKVYVKVEE